MKNLLKIGALLAALLMVLALFASCSKEIKTTNEPSAPAESSSASAESPASSGVSLDTQPSPATPSNQGKLSMGEQGSVPAFEW